MWRVFLRMWLRKNFTFQSGSIQIVDVTKMVVFPGIFTFQSGSIQIELKSFSTALSSTFTFQSGSIQIHSCKGISVKR